jgi:leucyl aminopeptidase
MHGFRGVDISVVLGTAPETDLLVVPAFENDDVAGVQGLDQATGGEWSRALGTGELGGKPGDQLLVPLTGPRYTARRALFVGAGRLDGCTGEMARRVASLAAITARQRRAPRVAVLLRGASAESEQRRVPRLVQAAAEGLTLGQLDTGIHKSGEPELPRLAAAFVVVEPGEDAGALQQAAERGRVIGECCNDARLLGNEPGNVLTPSVLARRTQALAAATELAVEILDENRIAELGMGMLAGVARGSAEPPRLIVLRHDPAGAAAGVRLGLVGKGITFDSGGISIKPADGMDRMKADMGGGAAVIAAMCALSRLRVPLSIVAVVPSTENMPGGRALKPGDVLRSASGKTVEVINTDAEGRLVLADGLWYARELGATHLADVATLTGACVVALGRITTGLFGTPDRWVDRVRRASDLAGERAWPMPLYDEYFEQLKSETADMVNVGGRPAAAITAAMFLKQFAGDLPWAHLDIAGTAWTDDAKPWQARGATGAGVRTLVELATDLANRPE